VQRVDAFGCETPRRDDAEIETAANGTFDLGTLQRAVEHSQCAYNPRLAGCPWRASHHKGPPPWCAS
jgi:hypothetical protein